jgi:hypothetical protein
MSGNMPLLCSTGKIINHVFSLQFKGVRVAISGRPEHFIPCHNLLRSWNILLDRKPLKTSRISFNFSQTKTFTVPYDNPRINSSLVKNSKDKNHR